MKPIDHPTTGLTRRACLVLVGSALSGCGGGGLASLVPGTGGTGSPLYSQGSISGFGSVIVNGIKFDDTQATVLIDGAAAKSADLRLGMVAGVQGQRSAADVTLGTAAAIEVWSIALGPVESVSGITFVASGMTIDTDSNTVFEGISAGSSLTTGQTVSVWGLQVATDGSRWRATRVNLVAASTNRVVTGLVSSQTTLNGWVLSGAGSLPTNTMVRLQGTSTDSTHLNVSSTQVLNYGFETYAEGTLEIEGVVTSIPANGRFMLGNIMVDASAPALSTLVSQLAVGNQIEVYGSWTSGVLLASQIVLEGEQSKGIEIEAKIETFTSVADFVMRGQRCDATPVKLSDTLATKLSTWKGLIKVKGTILGEVLMVTELEFEN